MGSEARFRFYQEPHVGWCYEFDRSGESREVKDNPKPSYPGMLHDDGERLILTIPVSRTDNSGELARKLKVDGQVFFDDEKEEKFVYDFPERLVFDSFGESVTLIDCRKIGRNFKLFGPGQGKVEVGIAISGAHSKDYECPHLVRVLIPGMSEWTRLDPIRVNPKWENGRLKGIIIEADVVRTVRLMQGLELKEEWSGSKSNGDSVATLRGDIFVRSIFEDPTSYSDHFDKHYLLRDLMDIAYWKPTGFQKVEFARLVEIDNKQIRAIQAKAGSDPEEPIKEVKEEWREVKSYRFRYQSTPHSATPLYFFSHVGEKGVMNWERTRERFGRAINPLLKLVDLNDAPIESRFIQSCVGLEGIGAQLRMDADQSPSKSRKTRGKDEPLHATLRRIISDIGFSFSDDWAKRTADLYNDIKHYDRRKASEPHCIANALRENELVFRTWAALKIGVKKNVVRERICLTDAARVLQNQGLFEILDRESD